MSTAKGYHDALLALSGNPVFTGARNNLLASISDNELLDVITHGLNTGSPRETLNAIATRLLDGLAKARKADDAAAPVEGKHGSDDGGDDDDSGGGGGRKSGRGAKPRKKTDEEGTPRRKRGPPKSAQTPASQGTQSSNTNKKRTGDCLMQDGKKRRDASPEPMDDEEDFFKAEGAEEQEVAKVPAKKVVKKSSTEAPATNSNTTASSSTAATTDTDTVTSSEDDVMWKEIQKLSVIRDLQLVDGNDSSDKEKNGDGNETDTRVPASRITKTTRIPDVEVRFKVPKMPLKTLHLFPLSFVKEFVRKFNKDYLMGEKNRTTLRKAIDGKLYNGRCIRCIVHPQDALGCRNPVRDPGWIWYWNTGCYGCLVGAKLCVMFDSWAGHTPVEPKTIVVTVYPIKSTFNDREDWRSMGFWVGA